MLSKINKNFVEILSFVVAIGVFVFVHSSFAAINNQINYQGKLTDASSVAKPDGNYTMVISIYNVDSGGTPLWTTTRSVAVANGIFSIMLGDTGAGDPAIALDFNAPYYLGVKVDADAEMTPRKPIGASAYAFNAGLLNGLASKETGADAHIATTDSSGNLTISGSTYFNGTTYYVNNLGTGNLNSLTLAGDLGVNGNDITSTGSLTVTPFAGQNFNVALSGAGDFAVNSNKLYVDSSSGYVGIGTASPSQGLEIGSKTNGLNLKTNATSGTEQFTSFVVASNWTLTAGWQATNDTGTDLNHNAAGVTAATFIGQTPTIGTTYELSFTVNATVTGGAAVSFGGVAGTALNPVVGTPTTYTMDIKAATVGQLILTPVTTARFVISSISIKPITAGTGDNYVDGDLYLGGSFRSNTGNNAFSIDPSGAVRMPSIIGPLTLNGNTLSGVTNLTMAGGLSGVTTMTHSGAITGTVPTLYVSTDGHVLTAAASTGVTSTLVPLDISPRIRQVGQAWDIDGAANILNNYWQEVITYPGNTVNSKLSWFYSQGAMAAVAEYQAPEIMNYYNNSFNVLGSAYGSESFTNGALITGSSWTVANGFSLATDTAVYVHNAAGGTLTQASASFATPVKANRWYRFTWTSSALNTTARAYIDPAGISTERVYLKGTVVTPGTYTTTFKTNSSPGNFILTADSAAAGDGFTLDDLSLVEVQSGDVVANGLFTGGGASGIKVDNLGKVGIGTTSPGALLDIGLAGNTLGVLRLAGSTSGNVSLQPNAVAGTGIVLTLPATTGTLVIGGGTASGTNTGDDAVNSSTMYIGTTAVALNRSSATLAMTGITSIDGTAAKATILATARSIYGGSFDGSADLSGIIASTYGGTGNGFTKFSGPATSEKTFTLPNANATLARTDAGQTFTGVNTMTAPVFNTSISTPSIITASGALGITPATGSNLNISLATTGNFAVNTNQLYVDTSVGYVGIGTITPLNKFVIANKNVSNVGLEFRTDGATISNADYSTARIYASNSLDDYPGARLDLQTATGENTWKTGLSIIDGTMFAPSASIGEGGVLPVVVSGTLTPNAAGTYAYKGQYNSKNYYQRGTDSWYIWYYGGGDWYISTILGGTNAGQDWYANGGVGSVPPLISGWSLGAGATGTLTTVAGSLSQVVIDSGGNMSVGGVVGIGTASPVSPLDVKGNVSGGGLVNIQNNATDGYSAIIFNDSSSVEQGFIEYSNSGATFNGTVNLGSLNAIPLVFATNSTERMRIDSAGKVGIGLTPTYTLDVKAAGTGVIARFASNNSTSCTLATGGTITCSSDINLKKNITDVGYGLDTLMQLRPVEFNWKSDADTAQHSLGFIAQDVEKLMPQLVMTDANGYEELNTIGMIPVLAKSIQQQQGEITSLGQLGNQNAAEISAAILAASEQASAVADVTLKTNNTAMTLQGLQASVDSQLSIVASNLDDHEKRIANLEAYYKSENDFQSQQAALNVQLQAQIDALKQITDASNIQLAIAQVDLNTQDISYMKTLLGIDSKNPADVKLSGRFSAKVVDGGALEISILDKDSPTIGSAIVTAVKEDSDEDGIDDKTGSDGKTTTIKTNAVDNDSKIYVTPVGSSGNQVPYVGKIKDNESFEIKVDQPVAQDVVFNWWIVQISK